MLVAQDKVSRGPLLPPERGADPRAGAARAAAGFASAGEYFLEEFCARNNFRPKTLDDAVFAVFEGYAWPGNARELRNAIERMAILTQGDRLTVESVPVEIRVPRESGARSSVQEARESAERDHILRALEENELERLRRRPRAGHGSHQSAQAHPTLGLARER